MAYDYRVNIRFREILRSDRGVITADDGRYGRVV